MNAAKTNAWLGAAYCILVALFIILPIASSFVFSFGRDRFPTLPPGEISAHWYREVWEDAKNWSALSRTLAVGVASSVTATLLGFCAAYTDYRYRFRGKNFFLSLVLLPPTIPLVIFGLAMLAYLSRAGLSGSMVSIWLGHTVMCMPFAMAIIRLRLHQMDENWEPAAWNLGASEWMAMRNVIIPFVWPGIMAAALISLAVSFDEYAVAWFVSGINETLPVRVLNFLQGQVSPRINVLGTVTFLATITLVLIAEFLMSRRGYDG